MKDQRKYVRIDKECVLRHKKYRLKPQDGDVFRTGVIKNYSAGGALFVSEQQYCLGDILLLEMTIPGWEKYKSEFYKEKKLSVTEPVIVLACVVRVEMIDTVLFDIGVCFVGIDDGHRWALIKQISEETKHGQPSGI